MAPPFDASPSRCIRPGRSLNAPVVGGAVAILAALLAPLPVLGQAAAGAITAAATPAPETRRLVSPEDYGRFESLGQAALSPDGRWAAAVIGRVEEDGEVRLARTDGGAARHVAHGARFEFSPDGRWLA